MHSRTNYWSCSKLAEKIRGIEKPFSATSDDWETWHQMAKATHKIRYWIAEEGLNHLQNFVNWPLDKLLDIKYYINNRWVTKSHTLTAHKDHLKPGHWCDLSERFLPCMFDSLVDFVEIESAHFYIVWADDDVRKKYEAPFWSRGIFYWRTWRCPQAGIDHLMWESGLTYKEDMGVEPNDPLYGEPTDQAKDAIEKLFLYTWYKNVYLKRPDPMDISGWSADCARKREKNGGRLLLGSSKNESQEEKEWSKVCLRKLHEIEEEYLEEETEMMTRLIKIRNSLWT